MSYYNLNDKLKKKRLMLVWILQTGEPLNCDGNQLRPMRAINLSNALVSKGHKVEIISTRFFHQKKRFRMRQSQINLAKNSGKRHIFQKQF